MRYTADALVRALEGARIEIGGRVHVARPLSVSTLLRVLTLYARDTLADNTIAALVVLRAAFPYRWWYRFAPWRDPARVALKLPPDLLRHVLRALAQVNVGPMGTRATDPVADAIALHRQLVHGGHREAERGAPLELAALHCEVACGAEWMYNPRRWPTSDGYAPAALVLLTFAGLQSWHALQRVEHATAVRAAHSSDGADQLRRWLAHAYPTE